MLAFYDGHSMKVMLPVQSCAPMNNVTGDLKTNAFCPCLVTTPQQFAYVQTKIIDKALEELKKRAIYYSGVFSVHLASTGENLHLVGFSCRFVCPVIEVLLSKLDTDLYDLIDACCNGQLTNIDIEWREGTAGGIVMTSEDSTAIGRKIIGALGLHSTLEK